MHVYARFPVEIQYFVVRKYDIFNLAVIQRAEDYRTYAYLFRYVFFVFKVGVLLVENGIRLFNTFIDNVF